MKNLFFLFVFIIPFFCFTQKEGNTWYFGYNAGLDFNSGSPVALTDGALSTFEGCSSISDTTGAILFYTDGVSVWNKNHTLMPNGNGLLGHFSSTQSSIIVRKPGSFYLYYIFTVDHLGFSNGLRYSEVDMSLNSGLGDITSNKNIPITSPSCEKITAIQHKNNEDYWIVCQIPNSKNINSYLLTSTGLNLSPIISSVGDSIGLVAETLGYLKASINGDKLVSVNWSIDKVQIFQFDNSSGKVSKPILLSGFRDRNPYGAEFSGNGEVLYVSVAGSGSILGEIYQFDLSSGEELIIQNSRIILGSSLNQGGALQLAPDNKIYYARNGALSLGVINNPDNVGVSCNYVKNGMPLGGKSSGLGLPNFTGSIMLDNIRYFSSINIPNVFTPNGDLINDRFSLTLKDILSIEGRIYNRWGQEMFFWDKLNVSWDGKHNSIDASEGTYYYIIKAIGIDGKSYLKRGSFSLFR